MDDIRLQEENTPEAFKEVTPEIKEEALYFDLIAYHTLLTYLFKVTSIDEAQNHSTEKYL